MNVKYRKSKVHAIDIDSKILKMYTECNIQYASVQGSYPYKVICSLDWHFTNENITCKNCIKLTKTIYHP